MKNESKLANIFDMANDIEVSAGVANMFLKDMLDCSHESENVFHARMAARRLELVIRDAKILQRRMNAIANGEATLNRSSFKLVPVR
jgi:hypothetical protein